MNKDFQRWEQIAWKVFNWCTGVTVVNAVAIFVRKYLYNNPVALIFMVVILLFLFLSAASILFLSPINHKIFKNSYIYALTIAVLFGAFELYFFSVISTVK